MRLYSCVNVATYTATAAGTLVSSEARLDGYESIAVVYDVTAIGGATTSNCRLQGRNVPPNGTAGPWSEVRFDKVSIRTATNSGVGNSGADALVNGALTAAQTYTGYVYNNMFNSFRVVNITTTSTVTGTVDICGVQRQNN